MIAEAKTRYALPIRTLAAQMQLSVASLSRWKRRLHRGEVAVGKRGPRKVKPLNLGELTERIRGLEHRKKRSQGSGVLHHMPMAVVSPAASSMPWSDKFAMRPTGCVVSRLIM